MRFVVVVSAGRLISVVKVTVLHLETDVLCNLPANAGRDRVFSSAHAIGLRDQEIVLVVIRPVVGILGAHIGFLVEDKSSCAARRPVIILEIQNRRAGIRNQIKVGRRIGLIQDIREISLKVESRAWVPGDAFADDVVRNHSRALFGQRDPGET